MLLKLSYGPGGGSKTINLTSTRREPMTYPMFFSRGETGWGKDHRKYGEAELKVRFPTYLAARILRRENGFFAASLLNSSCYIPSNRFLSMAHLGQMYCVDSISTMIDTVLKYTRDNQDVVTGGRRIGVQHEDIG